MSEQLIPDSGATSRSEKALRSAGIIASATAFLAFMAGAGALFVLPGHAGLNIPALLMGLLATTSGGVGIYTLNRYAAIHADDQYIALWTNLFCRVMAMVELFSLAAVFAWMIIHFVGLPAMGHFHGLHH